MRAATLAMLTLFAACSSDKGGEDTAGSGTTASSASSGTPPGATSSTGTPVGTPGGTSTGTTTGGGTTTGTPGGTTTPVTVTATCNPTNNALRFDCEVFVDPPQPVDLYYSLAAGGPEHTFSSDDVVNDHDILVYMMKADTVYDFRAVPRDAPQYEATGQFTSGTLPVGCDLNPIINGTSSSPYFIAQSPCTTGAHVLVLDQDGDTVWCENFQPGAVDPMIEGTTFTEDGTILTVVADHIIEKDFAGTELLRLQRLVDFDEHVHHDVYRKNGYTYLLFNETVSHDGYDYDLDGIHVFQGTTWLATWHLSDHFLPGNPPIGWPGRDYSHGNAVWVDSNLDMLVSFRHLSAVASVVADPTSPYFGDLNFKVSDSISEWTTDYRIGAPNGVAGGFQKQHNPHYLPGSGYLSLFDNRTSIAEFSRLLHIELATAADEGEIREVYELPMHCDFQGGSWHTSSGNPVATCAPQRKAFEWDPGQVVTRFDITLECATGLNTYVPRLIPWDGPWAPPATGPTTP